ncbi:MAG: polyprenyl synthetase family protein [Bacillota bacterium]
MIKINQVIKKEKNIIDKRLEEMIDEIRKNSSFSLNTIIDSMEYSIKAGGKRIRPILTVKVAEMVDGNKETAYRIGTALELIHTYSLIHDDLPAMDDDDYRRGQLSNHKVFGEGMAVLAGDGLLTYAFELLSNLKLDSKKVLKVINLAAKNAGFKGMVGGQSLDLKYENEKIDLDTLINIHSLKTGALFQTAVLGGAYCGNPTDNDLKALNSYAKNLGLLFQITDDILDKISSTEILGKTVGSDEQSNKSTYVSLLGLEEAKQKAQQAAKQAKNELKIFQDSEFLSELIDYILKRKS